MPDTQKRLEAIELRNRRVESDTAWETSWTRRHQNYNKRGSS